MFPDDPEQEDEKGPAAAAWREAYEKTHKSLIERLGDWEDQKSWDAFYKRYWKLIYSVALKSGLRSEEALDVVQETILTIAKQQKEHRYDANVGTFKSWLMNQTRWRIADQFRKRAKDTAMLKFEHEDDERNTATLDRMEDPDAHILETVWDAEWKKSLADRALAAVKLKVSPKQYQIFDCYVVKGWGVRRVMQELGVSMAQVYLAKHRVGGLMRKEVLGLEGQLF
ncbi:MAG: sigma-70 family RNA polymerase sigma factor [Verrucomicrobiales bacterium]|nr:sigma-70 family RNA polymerase sigma factor [Verrucomicrobiales bacterium]